MSRGHQSIGIKDAMNFLSRSRIKDYFKVNPPASLCRRLSRLPHPNKEVAPSCTLSLWWRFDVYWWCKLMCAIRRGFNHINMMTSSNGPMNSPHKGQWRGALIFSLICAWINDWVNNREAGDLRRHRGHYDVNVMDRNMSNTILQVSL